MGVSRFTLKSLGLVAALGFMLMVSFAASAALSAGRIRVAAPEEICDRRVRVRSRLRPPSDRGPLGAVNLFSKRSRRLFHQAH